MATVSLDRAQREAIREEIQIDAGLAGEIRLSMKPDRDGCTDRDYVLRTITNLELCVAALDAIRWQEPPDAPDDLVIEVDSVLANWAHEQAVRLEQAFTEFHITDEDLDALTGLRLLAGKMA